ncbi:MAG TPA: hypothetical protein PLG92_03730 [Piscinibacter sp.]|jgi:hypothetical protein|uniref:FFLEELY motif protein n=1 Tax=Piscinibacter sp. TaxID=1903157 RepID=UPI002C16D3A7|nr:hypothetical protein [Plasticicumulans sp.]HNJ82076.1 hypothetical protein [Piscinibacter sp.]HNK17469.1 hypothetical protein [Piscinibacter sp.]
MAADAQAILSQLTIVRSEREARAADGALGETVRALKAYQQQRFSRTYADLLASSRYAAASRFFLDELYGPQDFSDRDAQFARVVPALVRLFPQELVETVAVLARLHALSESLDSTMGRHLLGRLIDRSTYIEAWQLTGRAEAREEQIRLTLAVGRDLDSLTRKPLLRTTLHLMRGPARAAGLPALQQFLETGFDTFKAMGGAEEFLAIVGTRERALAAALFERRTECTPEAAALGQLP